MNPIHRWIDRRERQIVAFLTAGSSWRKAAAAFNAAACEAVLSSRFILKSALRRHEAAKPLVADPVWTGQADLLNRLHAEAAATGPWRAALGLFRKAGTHKSWEKTISGARAEAYIRVLAKVNAAQRAKESFNAAALNLDGPYDSRLSRLTPGLRADHVRDFTAAILARKDELQEAARARDHIGVRLAFAPETQERIIRRVLHDMGVNAANTDIRFSTHPMCFGANGRAQLLLRAGSGDLTANILDAVHEGGHALYRIRMPKDARDSLMGLIETHYAAQDECAAMIWDMHIALTPAFARYLHRVVIEEAGPECPAGLTPDHLCVALNHQPRATTRIKARPAAYALFMAQYAAMEDEIFAGTLAESDLPARWGTDISSIHGYDFIPRDVTQGPFQDPHWALGELGRFSGGYLPGMLMAAQSVAAMTRDWPGFLDGVEKGDFSGIVKWCDARLYAQPRRTDYNDFMVHATGAPLEASCFLDNAVRMPGVPHFPPMFQPRTDLVPPQPPKNFISRFLGH